MENKNNNSKRNQIILSVLGILSLILVTVGVTYAVFTYTKLGETENTITTGTLKFLYTENTGVGKGIQITNAFPVSDTVGKAYATDGYVFDFQVEGTNTGTEAIPYEVTLREKAGNTLDGNIVKVYLTDMNEDADTEIVAPTIFTKLTDTAVDTGISQTEKTLYTGTVNAGEMTYLQEFRLRMWIDEEADFSAVDYAYKNATTGKMITAVEYTTLTTEEQSAYAAIAYVNESTNTAVTQAEYEALEDTTGYVAATTAQIYPYNGKTFVATVNVYSNVPTVDVGA